MAEEEQQVGDDVQQEYEEDGMEHEDGLQEVDELEAMKQKLKELEDEANKLRAQQGGAAAAADAAGGGGEDGEGGDGASKEEVDARSIFVNSVDFAVTPEELQNHFAQCGTVNRVTVLTDKFGTPKGYAYIEFLEVDAVDNAILLDNSELHGRAIKVSRKRTNVPGLKRGRGRGRGRGGGYYAPRGRGGYGYGGGYYGGGYGYAPKGRGRGRGYAPY